MWSVPDCRPLLLVSVACCLAELFYECPCKHYSMKFSVFVAFWTYVALCGFQGCKNRPAPFPGRMSYKTTKPGYFCFISAWFIVLLFIRAPFLCIVTFRCYVFCLLVVLVKLSVLAKWLARKTSLRKPNRSEGIVSIKPRPKRAYDCVGLLYRFIV